MTSTSYGQITEQEAASRGLLQDAIAETAADGRVLVRHVGTRLQWTPRIALVRPAAPFWRGGMPCV